MTALLSPYQPTFCNEGSDAICSGDFQTQSYPPSLKYSLLLPFATFAVADKTKMKVKVGDELYICACGEGCPCDTMSRNAGQCSCGKDMVKTKVTKVEADDTAGYPLSRVRRLANNKAC